jgi:hypothetical protein
VTVGKERKAKIVIASNAADGLLAIHLEVSTYSCHII